VRPEFRRRGIGRSLAEALIEEARGIGYSSLRLDTSPVFVEAPALYRSVGFREIEPYEGNEVPEEFYRNWTFMEMALK